MYDGYEALRFESRGPILTVYLVNPSARNAVNQRMHEELSRVFFEISRDRDVRVVVLRGAPEGKAFCSGGDLRWLQKAACTPEGYAEILRQGIEIVRSMLFLPQPILAMVDGPAVGLGATLALFADISLMAEDAKIADPHVAVGVVAGDGGAVMWPLLMGPNRAKEFLMTGDALTGAEAARIGLVNHAYPRDKLEGETYRLAERLAGGPRLAIEWTKRSVNLFIAQVMNTVLTASLALEGITFQTNEHQEAVQAFLEKTPSRPGSSTQTPGGDNR
ncbi:MAG: enoyl-CoA hydratase/isomerase family protein [Hydrogenibacillus schlegelii]|uniref:Enoyl-CoA hydratase/isomerase family protein n=1 Tax=Hydrogenibacillus schlegelii TaxID=1484 RepID=A0A947CVV4_HYDSH|nr:enoyl-CoA hydratase/isomerase family protein [Hydrogenibacillus schlegelii]